MKTDRPFRHGGADIIYPDKTAYVDGVFEVDNYLPDVLRRGLRHIPGFVSQLNPNPHHQEELASRDAPIFQRITKDGLATRLGLVYDDTRAVDGAAVDLARIVSAEVGPGVIATQRIALLGYAAVAECQRFRDANKRAGRMLYGRIQHGYEPEAIARGINAVLDDEVPPDIERLVLLQNLVRCTDDTEPARTEFGGIYVPSHLEASFNRQRKLLDRYRFASTNEERSTRDFYRNISQLGQQLDNVLENAELAGKVTNVLIQEEYGPAAWLLCCEDMKLDDMTADIAYKLAATSTRLLQMRIVALLNAVANGGKFVEIIDSKDESAERQVQVRAWTPTEVSSE